MALSEKFNKYSKHYLNIAKDPYMIGGSVAFAACTIPFNAVVSATAIAAPIVYAGVGVVCRAAGYGLQLAGR